MNAQEQIFVAYAKQIKFAGNENSADFFPFYPKSSVAVQKLVIKLFYEERLPVAKAEVEKLESQLPRLQCS